MITGKFFLAISAAAGSALVLMVMGCASPQPSGSVQQRGAMLFHHGDFAAAAVQYRQSAAAASDANDLPAECDALIGLGSASEMIGDYTTGKDSLEQAADLAGGKLKDPWRTAAALNALGVAYTLKPEPGAVPSTQPGDVAVTSKDCCAVGSARCHEPEMLLKQALALAAGLPQTDRVLRLEASIHDNLGNYYADSQGFEMAVHDDIAGYDRDTAHFENAQTEYQACQQIGLKLRDPFLQAKGAANAGSSDLAAARFFTATADRAARGNKEKIRLTESPLRNRSVTWASAAQAADKLAISLAGQIAESSGKAFVLNQIGQTDEHLARLENQKDDNNSDDLARTQQAYMLAAGAAGDAGDSVSLSYAKGYLGHRAEISGDVNEAMDLTRQAIFWAQKAQSPDSLYRWQWQMGRLLQRTQQSEQAIAYYQQAVETVKMIRNDIALGNGNQRNRFTFREEVGQLYYDLADLLLIKAKGTAQGSPDEKTLVDARSAVESLKSAELEDYFRDRCVQVVKTSNNGRQLSDTNVDGTAIIYVIPLADRIELLVQIRGHLYQRISRHSQQELQLTVRDLVKALGYFADDEYLPLADTVRQWLIDPIQPLLDENKIDTLVFVPDGLLRAVPMAALHDSNTGKFLIEQYAIAVIPGLDLMDSSATSHRTQGNILLSGLSQARPDSKALPSVPIELDDVRRAYGTGRSTELLNENFVVKNMKDQVRSNQFGIVHIASHGHFGADANHTYILTYDPTEPLTLDGLEELIRPQQYATNGKSKPIDLLVLSCCETAKGDDRAALGLAGVAIKSGARSALATLWSANDQGSAPLIEAFYKSLTNPTSGNQMMTKARALQQAQVSFIHSSNDSFRHPLIWSPYIIIGNWQ